MGQQPEERCADAIGQQNTRGQRGQDCADKSDQVAHGTSSPKEPRRAARFDAHCCRNLFACNYNFVVKRWNVLLDEVHPADSRQPAECFFLCVGGCWSELPYSGTWPFHRGKSYMGGCRMSGRSTQNGNYSHYGARRAAA
jgi:hypothetical protein